MTWGLLAAVSPRRRDAPRLPKIEALALPDKTLSRPVPREDLPNGPYPHARRAFAAKPELLPKDPSIEAFMDWLGNKADDLSMDELAELRLSICLLAGWPPPKPERKQRQPRMAVTAKVEPEPAPTPEPEPEVVEPELAVIATPEPDLEPEPDRAPTSRTIETLPSRVSLQAERAAERFLEWLRLNGHVGEHGHEAMHRLYARHCEAEDVAPMGFQPLRNALAQIGVEKRQCDMLVTTGKRKRSRRHRPTVWVIRPLETVVGDIPWSDLPDREAAA